MLHDSPMNCLGTIHAGLRHALCALLLGAILGAPQARAALPDFGRFASTDVLLVVAPHPDDETLCCAGAIQLARAAGARVAIVWITSGDGFELDAHVVEHRLFTGTQGLVELARLRMQEASRAAQLLGVAPVSRFFLGYPDGGIAYLMDDRDETIYRSAHTGAEAVPYAEALRPGAPYTRANLERDLRTVINRVQPTWVLAPTPLDLHPDHRATGVLVIRALDVLGQSNRARYWIVHGGIGWPWPRGLHPEESLVPPARARALPWEELALLPVERTHKESAIRIYDTQMRLTSGFMLSFVKRNEIYSPVPYIGPIMSAVIAHEIPVITASQDQVGVAYAGDLK
jgi:LmbE family N-acetylglucosaminyl deacetylase